MVGRSMLPVLVLVAGCGDMVEQSKGGARVPGCDDCETPLDGPDEGGGRVPVKPDTLTAGAWDDNLNFDYYRAYLAEMDAQQIAGLPRVPRDDRVLVLVRDSAGAPLPGADVEIRQENRELARGVTGAEGRLYFFPAWDGATPGATVDIEAQSDGAAVTLPFVVGSSDTAIVTIDAQAGLPAQLDIALVLDTTGSMDDEIRYLKAEFDAIVGAVQARYRGVSQKWALVAYRDEGDAYVVRTRDFTEAADFGDSLERQHASGGGDYPEALEQALSASSLLSWRGGNTARVVFHVADAPAHSDQAGAIVAAVRALREKGVHVYPVAASGTGDLAEYTFRTEAQITGGRYLFLTDDSGVGAEHKEPSIPCYFVTMLSGAMLRMLDTELTGQRHAPEPTEIIRTGGDPHNGACRLPDGRQVQIF